MKKLFFFLVAILLPVSVFAYDVKIDGIYYVLNKTNKTAWVTNAGANSDENIYIGDVIIPSEIIYENESYIVTTIDGGAFYGCSALTSISIPNSVTSIGPCAFDYTGWYDNQPDGVLYLDNWFLGYKGDKPIGAQIIKEGTRGIMACAFDGCYGLTSITLPNSIISICEGAFAGCSALTSITIPNGVKFIGPEAFSNCRGLTSFNIPNSVTNIGDNAFSNTGWYNNQPDGILYHDNWILGYKESEITGTIAIKEGTIGICDLAFTNCGDLHSATFPNSLAYIGNDAFSYCSGLNSINIPKNVTFIGGFAFGCCSGLSSITVDSENTIYDSRDNCNAIICSETNMLITGCKNSIIPNNVTSIGDNAFYGCIELTSITIPNSVTTLGTNAFAGCTSLTSLTIPHSVTTIDGAAFSGCTSLNSVTIPNNVTFIGNSAFEGCSGLTSVKIGTGVKTIGLYAFLHCNNLIRIDVLSEVPPVLFDAGVFSVFSNYNATLRVPIGSLERYQNADGWRKFSNIREGFKYKLTYVVDNIIYSEEEYDYNESIKPKDNPSMEGFTFSGWSDIPETMPEEDLVVYGSFTVNKYKLIFQVDGEDYQILEIEFGSSISTLDEPKGREGYTFSGWSEAPRWMPAHDVIVTGSFVVNKYIITYMVEGTVVAVQEVEYGSTIVPPVADDEGNGLMWNSHPTTMPAYDLTIYGSYVSGINPIAIKKDNYSIFSTDGMKQKELKKGVNIIRTKGGKTKKVVVK